MELLVPFALVVVGVLAVTTWLTRVAAFPTPPAPLRRRASDAPAPAPAGPALPRQQPVPRRAAVLSGFLPVQDENRLLVPDTEGLPPLYLEAHAAELWLAETTTGQLVTLGNGRLRALGIWSVWLRAVDARTIVAREGLVHAGCTVSLVREAGQAQAGAIAVHSSTGRSLGHVSPRIAVGLVRMLDAGTPLRAVVMSFEPSTGARPGLLKLLVASPDTVTHLLRRLPEPLSFELRHPRPVLSR